MPLSPPWRSKSQTSTEFLAKHHASRADAITPPRRFGGKVYPLVMPPSLVHEKMQTPPPRVRSRWPPATPGAGGLLQSASAASCQQPGVAGAYPAAYGGGYPAAAYYGAAAYGAQQPPQPGQKGPPSQQQQQQLQLQQQQQLAAYYAWYQQQQAQQQAQQQQAAQQQQQQAAAPRRR